MSCQQLGFGRGCALIKIRYADLPGGLHVRTEASGRSTIIYLLPGLTPAERQSALLRVRRSASMGYGPRLPAAGVAAAIARDRVRATARNGAAAFRVHPLLLVPPMLMAASATLAYVMLSTVSITFHQAAPGAPAGQVPSQQFGRPGSGPAGHLGSGASLDRPGGAPGGRHPGAPGRAKSPSAGSSSPSSPQSPMPGPSGSAPSDPAPSGSPSPAPSPSPSPSPSKCLNLGPVGVCLK